MAPIVLSSVDAFTQTLKGLLHTASETKSDGGIAPSLDRNIFGDRIDHIGEAYEPPADPKSKTPPKIQAQFAGIETASRNILHDLITTTPIGDTAFSQVWNLLDIITLISDADRCEPGLPFWLVEDLLDSQTIDGCRVVFDYLESRRERMCAKRLSKKSLIILRACNELLRRLSRAEDTVFCGRVFIYLFHSFPLGDRSSINLRGEYHTENVTVFDTLSGEPDQQRHELMDVDEKAEKETPQEAGTAESPALADGPDKTVADGVEAAQTAAKADGQLEKAEPVKEDNDEFYTEFWSLQRNFAMPTRLFQDEHFRLFKQGMGSTMRVFQSVDQGVQSRNTSSAVYETKRGAKRKRGDQAEELSNTFNPKYLTSRDLFELEISDLAFRRHMLVQALILIDFLLSHTPKAKKKLAGKGNNKAVLYNYVLSEEDTQWATQMRSDIATYLQQGPEGKFYYRMVDTVLSRDKNWTQWKAESCPDIQRQSVSAEEFVEARKGAQKACASRRLKANPLGSVNLNFLSETGTGDGLKKLMDSERYSIPTVDSFKGPIAEDDFDIEMAKDEEGKQHIKDARASKIWRTLRVASKSKFKLFHKIEDSNKPDVLFETKLDENQENEDSDDTGGPEKESTTADSELIVSNDSLLEIPQ